MRQMVKNLLQIEKNTNSKTGSKRCSRTQAFLRELLVSFNEGLSLVIMQTIAASLELRFQYLIALPQLVHKPGKDERNNQIRYSRFPT